VQEGTDNTRAVTPAGLLAGLLGAGGVGTSDYIKIPFRDKTSGARRDLIVQWFKGTTSSTNGADSVITFPIAFPTNVMSVLTSFNEFTSPFSDATQPVHVVYKTLSSVTIRSYTGYANGVNILAIGY
jgi:hypothetical protein